MDPSFLSGASSWYLIDLYYIHYLCTNPDAQQPWYSDDLNLEQYWDEVPPLSKSIERGNAMRVVKLRRVPLPRELQVRGISNKSPCKYHREKSQTKSKQKSSARCNCPLNGPKKSKISRPALSKNTLTCPLRIIELAAPSKRHCIETWLSKGYILPAYMTDRLQRYITDQTPIVQIPDAVRCFKRKKRIPQSLKSNERPRTKIDRTEKQMAALRVLCGTFGFKVFENLNTEVPHTMPLSADLKKVCDVVTKDIISIMATRRNKTNIRNNKTVISEIANRITIWIAIILQESAYKQLQEEYNELEEEEGHILDFLDDIVNDVLNTCEPYPQEPEAKQFLRDWSSVSSKTSDGEDKHKAYGEDKCISDYLLNEILNDLDFVEENNEFFEQEEISEHREQTDAKDIILPDDDKNLSATFFDATDLKEELDMISELIEKTAFIDDQDKYTQKELENAEEDVNDPGKDVSTIDNTSKDQSSEVQENETEGTQEEDSHDDANRKVKFTNNDENLEESLSESNKRKSWQTSTDHNLIIGPVNDHLLNDADEVWPEYESTPPLKITASVSKSITSLGKIKELDEASVITSSADLIEEIIEDKVLQEIELSTDDKTMGLESGVEQNTLPIETTEPVADDTAPLPIEISENGFKKTDDTDVNDLLTPLKITGSDIQEIKTLVEIFEPDNIETEDLTLAVQSTEHLKGAETADTEVNIADVSRLTTPFNKAGSNIEEDNIPVETSEPDNTVVEDIDFLSTKTAVSDTNNIADDEAAELMTPSKISEFNIEENKIRLEASESDDVEATNLALPEESTEPLDITETRDDGIMKIVESVGKETAPLPPETAESDINTAADAEINELTKPSEISETNIEENKTRLETSESDDVESTNLALLEESTVPLDITEIRKDGITKIAESVGEETAPLPTETAESDINTDTEINELTKPSEISETNIEKNKSAVEISELQAEVLTETDDIDKVASAIQTTEHESNVSLVGKQPSIAKESHIILPTEDLRSPKETKDREQDALQSALYILSETKELTKVQIEMEGPEYIASPEGPQHITSSEGPPTPYEEIVKFDYKVYLDTAPSWVRIGSGEPSEEGSMRTLVPQKINERDYRKLCQEIIDVASKIEKGYQWIDNVTSNVNYLKSKHAISKRHGKYNPRLELQDWNKLKRSVDKDVVLWTKLCRKARDRLDRRNKDFADAMVSAKYGYRCQCNTRKMKT